MKNEVVKGTYLALVVKTPCSQCRGHGFSLGSWNKEIECCRLWLKKKRKEKEKELSSLRMTTPSFLLVNLQVDHKGNRTSSCRWITQARQRPREDRGKSAGFPFKDSHG